LACDTLRKIDTRLVVDATARSSSTSPPRHATVFSLFILMSACLTLTSSFASRTSRSFLAASSRWCWRRRSASSCSENDLSRATTSCSAEEKRLLYSLWPAVSFLTALASSLSYAASLDVTYPLTAFSLAVSRA